MKRLKTISLVLILSIFVVAGSAFAIPYISGELYTGGFTFDSSFDASTATSLPSMTGTALGFRDLAGLTNTSITFKTFYFGIPPNPIVENYWAAGGFSFDLTNIQVAYQQVNQLGLVGSGILSKEGFSDSIATWDINITDGKSAFSFSTSSSVSEPGTMLLLGAGLIGWGLTGRRKFFRK